MKEKAASTKTFAALDKTFMLAGIGRLSEPFDYGMQEKRPPDSPVPEVQQQQQQGQEDPDVNTASSLLQQFASETSAHGCSLAISSSRGVIARTFWALAVLGMLGAMVYTLYSMLAAYDDYPFNTVTKVTVKESLPFPGVTLCNINEVDTSLMPLDEETFRTTKENLLFHNPLNESDPEVVKVLNTSIDQIVNSSWVGYDQFLMYCLINDAWVDCREYFHFIQSTRARCVTLDSTLPKLNFMANAGPISGLRVYLNMHQAGYVYGNNVAAGVKLFLHEPDQLPDLLSSGYLLAPGFSHYVSTRPVEYKFLPKPYMAYGDEACMAESELSDRKQLRLTPNYTYAACNLECTVDVVADWCGCRGVLNDGWCVSTLEINSQYITSNGPFKGRMACLHSGDPFGLHHISRALHKRVIPDRCLKTYAKSLCVSEVLKCVRVSYVYFNVSSDNKCECPRPCDYTEYNAQISSALFPSEVATKTLQALNILPANGVRSDFRTFVSENFMELRVFLDKLILQEVVHEPVYTYVSVMGTIGGQMGFFLGASVLTAAELVELVCCFLFRFLRGLSGPKKRVTQVNVAPAKLRLSALSS